MNILTESRRGALITHLEQLQDHPFQNEKAITKLIKEIPDHKWDEKIEENLAMETDSLANLLLALGEINQYP